MLSFAIIFQLQCFVLGINIIDKLFQETPNEFIVTKFSLSVKLFDKKIELEIRSYFIRFRAFIFDPNL